MTDVQKLQVGNEGWCLAVLLFGTRIHFILRPVQDVGQGFFFFFSSGGDWVSVTGVTSVDICGTWRWWRVERRHNKLM